MISRLEAFSNRYLDRGTGHGLFFGVSGRWKAESESEGEKVDCPRLMPPCKQGNQTRGTRTGNGDTPQFGIGFAVGECPGLCPRLRLKPHTGRCQARGTRTGERGHSPVWGRALMPGYVPEFIQKPSGCCQPKGFLKYFLATSYSSRDLHPKYHQR